MTKQAAETGPGPTFMVAVEQFFPEDVRILHDDLASSMMPLSLRAFLWAFRLPWIRDWMVRVTEKRIAGIWSGIMCRKRYIDEKLTEAASGQIQAVVNLGAGFDTRLYRLPALANIPAWEVDQPQNINAKRARLRKIFGAVPSHIRLVPIDLDNEDLADVLASHGYAADKRIFFIWEAVSQYLTEAGIQATFDFLSGAPVGSRLAFTYICRDFIAGEDMYGQEFLYKEMVTGDRTWFYGMDPAGVADLLSGYGWRVLAHLRYSELAERYVEPTGRQLACMELERMVYAEKM